MAVRMRAAAGVLTSAGEGTFPASSHVGRGSAACHVLWSYVASSEITRECHAVCLHCNEDLCFHFMLCYAYPRRVG